MIIDIEWRPHNFTELLISIFLTGKRTLVGNRITVYVEILRNMIIGMESRPHYFAETIRDW